MAPEMLKGQPYDFKCDVWNMGVILYEMTTKRLPFPGTVHYSRSPYETRLQIISITCVSVPLVLFPDIDRDYENDVRGEATTAS